MTSVHPLSQAEAARVFDAKDRAEAKKRKRNNNINIAQLTVDLANEKQTFRRHIHKCALHWGEYNCASGTLKDLFYWDLYATRAQKSLSKIEKIKRQIKEGLGQ